LLIISTFAWATHNKEISVQKVRV